MFGIEEDGNLHSTIEKERKNKFGFIAQDVAKIYPELVKYNEQNDVYGVDYVSFIPLLVEALQDQQKQIDELQSCCSKDNIKNNHYKSSSKDQGYQGDAALYQNTPNPFTDQTTISYFLPENAENAVIYIYDMNGTQLKSYQLHQTGNGSITIQGGELVAGMYMYTLIVDGKEVETKRMILTD